MATLIRFFIISAQLTWQVGRYAVGRLLYLLLAWRWPARERLARIHRLRALCFTDFFRNLGATFIKIGQILSSRPDMLPDYIIDELKLLQDRVPPFDYAHVRRIFLEDFGRHLEDAFARIDERPIAAASIAQVHEAWLRSGERVAVKVRRPDIETNMTRDLAVINAFAWVVDHLPYLSVLHLRPQTRAFADAIRAQLDLKREAENNRRFTENFKDLAFVKFPPLHDEYCSGRVLTMGYCEGKKIDQILDAPPLPRRELAERLFRFYSQMMLGDQFVHADLHPGNVLIDEEGNFLLLDTGLVAQIEPAYVRRFLKLALAASTFDGPILLRTYLEDRDGPPLTPATLARAESDAKRISDKLQGKTMGELEFGLIFMDMFALLRKYKVWMEPQLTIIFVSDITMEGMAKTLDPRFDMPAHLQQAVPRFMRKMDWLKPEDLVVRFYKEREQKVG